jgi:hypothetical protein
MDFRAAIGCGKNAELTVDGAQPFPHAQKSDSA